MDGCSKAQSFLPPDDSVTECGSSSSMMGGGGGVRSISHFVYICSDLPLELLPLKGTIIHTKYSEGNIPLKGEMS